MKKKVLFLINSLGGGGAEKALVNLVNNIDSNKYDVTVETMFADGVNAKFLNSNINYISKKAPCPKGISLLIKLIPSCLLYKFFIGKNDYDVLIAYMHGIPVKVICGNKSKKRLAWLHNGNPESSTMFSPWLTLKSAIKDYASCSAVVGVCKSVSDAFSDYTGIKDNVCVAYNTLDTNLISEMSKKPIDIEIDDHKINIVSTGRLGKEKGYSRLLDVCKDLKDKGYNFCLYLIGTGSEEQALKNQAAELGLNNEVVFLGYQENPYKYVGKCDIFVCSSYTEGLSTATIEALILGKAIISTDVSGVYEILGDSEYGLVVENSRDGIYEGLKELFNNSRIINEYENKSIMRRTHFCIENTVIKVERIIDDLL